MSEQPTQQEQIKKLETDYTQKAMVLGDLEYKMACLTSNKNAIMQQMADINQEIVKIKGPHVAVVADPVEGPKEVEITNEKVETVGE